MSEPNYLLVGFMCVIIVICYALGFIMGQWYEQSKLKDKERAEEAERKLKKAGRRVIRR
tara:strand:+ start:300 stop:476 length:177 start_codon:yes stop_codon:yes gene_type:complete